MNPRAFQILLCASCFGLGAATLRGQAAIHTEDVPLSGESGSAAQVDAADYTVRWKLDAARSAVEDGFASLGLRLYESALEETNYALLHSPAFILNFSSALIAENRPEEALNLLDRYPEKSEPAYLLRRALASYLLDDLDSARFAIGAFDPEQLSRTDRAWAYLLRAMLLEINGEMEEANELFRRARDLAPNSTIRTQFEVFRLRNELFSGQASEELVTELRATQRSMEGQLGGFEAGRLLAIALNQLGRSDEAIAVIERQLRTPGIEESGLRDSFLLLLGVIAGEESGRGRLALRQLMSEPADRDLQETALYLLLQGPLKGEGRPDFRDFLDELIEQPEPHPLLDELLAVRAILSANSGRFNAAETDATRVLEEFPGSPLVDDMVRLMAYLSWNREPPRYRVAADYLNRLRSMVQEPRERARLGLLMADCYFLNGDFQSAAEIYASVMREHPEMDRAEVFYQRVLAEIRAGRLDLVATLLDEARRTARVNSEFLWKAEWNLVDAMKRSGRVDDALVRARQLVIASLNQPVPPSLEARFRWLMAELSLEAGQVGEVPTLADNLVGYLDSLSDATMPADERRRLRSRAILLKAEALLAQGNREAATAIFNELRQTYPDSDAAILSYLIEARGASARDSLVNAQQSLIELADLFPGSRYAPIALWEAALNAEKRGLNSSYQEAIALLERLATDYPAHELVFYARLKQADLSRRLNDFGTALLLYERIINQFPAHPDRVRAQLSRADTLLARGSQQPDSLDEAAGVYERLSQSPAASTDLRAEAAFKLGSALLQRGDRSQAEAAWWLALDRFLKDSELSSRLGSRGRFWIARAGFELATLLESDNRSDEARNLYQLIIDAGLPGMEVARQRLQRFRDAS